MATKIRDKDRIINKRRLQILQFFNYNTIITNNSQTTIIWQIINNSFLNENKIKYEQKTVFVFVFYQTFGQNRPANV
jgi:hypothetical protein